MPLCNNGDCMVFPDTVSVQSELRVSFRFPFFEICTNVAAHHVLYAFLSCKETNLSNPSFTFVHIVRVQLKK